MIQAEILSAKGLTQYIDFHDALMGELPSAIELPFGVFNHVLGELNRCVYDIATAHDEICSFEFRTVRIIRQDIHEI